MSRTNEEIRNEVLKRKNELDIKRSKQKKSALIIPMLTILIVALFINAFNGDNSSLPQNAAEFDATEEITAKAAHSVKAVSGVPDMISPYKTDEEKFHVKKSVVLRGCVTDTRYVLEGSTVYTKSEVKIIETYKGEFEKGDLIHVRELGGFIPSDVMRSAISAEKFGLAPEKNEEESELLDIRAAGFKVMEKGEEVILFLLPITKTDNKDFENCYELLRLWQGKLLYEEEYNAFMPYCPSWDLAESNEANRYATVKIKNVGENVHGAEARAYTLEEFQLLAKNIKQQDIITD